MVEPNREICPEFIGTWGEPGACRRMQGSERVRDDTCTLREQGEYMLYGAGGIATGDQRRAARSANIFEDSKCVQISSEAAYRRGAVRLPVQGSLVDRLLERQNQNR